MLLIRSEHVNENLVITIQDNGAGMDAESMNRLLDQNDMKRVESGISIGILNVNARLKRLSERNTDCILKVQQARGQL